MLFRSLGPGDGLRPRIFRPPLQAPRSAKPPATPRRGPGGIGPSRPRVGPLLLGSLPRAQGGPAWPRAAGRKPEWSPASREGGPPGIGWARATKLGGAQEPTPTQTAEGRPGGMTSSPPPCPPSLGPSPSRPAPAELLPSSRTPHPGPSALCLWDTLKTPRTVGLWGWGLELGLRGGDRKSTRLNSSHRIASRMPSSA